MEVTPKAVRFMRRAQSAQDHKDVWGIAYVKGILEVEE